MTHGVRQLLFSTEEAKALYSEWHHHLQLKPAYRFGQKDHLNMEETRVQTRSRGVVCLC
jgi:hypothetical protein